MKTFWECLKEFINKVLTTISLVANLMLFILERAIAWIRTKLFSYGIHDETKNDKTKGS